MVFLQVDKNYVIWKKNVHKKIEKFAKNYMYLKKKLFPSLPSPLHHPHQQTKHTKNYETFVEIRNLLRFFFFLTLPIIREKNEKDEKPAF